jgi:hypothetical protein
MLPGALRGLAHRHPFATGVISPASPVGVTREDDGQVFASDRMGGFVMMADADAAGTDDGRGAMAQAEAAMPTLCLSSRHQPG